MRLRCFFTNDVIKPGLHSRVLYFSAALLLVCGFNLFASLAHSATIMYVANADSHDISVFQLNEQSGHATLLQTLAVDGVVMPMALSPDKRLLYAVIRSEPYRVVVLAIDPITGQLTPSGSAPLVDSMANISLDPRGRYFFAASYGGNKISMSQLDKNGIPKVPAQVLPTAAHPHQISGDPANRFIYVSLLGANRVDYFRINSATEKLQRMPEPSITLPSGSGPRHFAFSSSGKFLYVLDELQANIHVLKRDQKTGMAVLVETQALLPVNSLLKRWAADIHVTPDGKFLYASERTTSRLYGFRVNQKDGKLTSIGQWDTERQPRAFAISPEGSHLIAVGQQSHQMTIYAINPVSGELDVVGREKTGMNPSWVEIISLPQVD